MGTAILFLHKSMGPNWRTKHPPLVGITGKEQRSETQRSVPSPAKPESSHHASGQLRSGSLGLVNGTHVTIGKSEEVLYSLTISMNRDGIRRLIHSQPTVWVRLSTGCVGVVGIASTAETLSPWETEHLPGDWSGSSGASWGLLLVRARWSSAQWPHGRTSTFVLRQLFMDYEPSNSIALHQFESLLHWEVSSVIHGATMEAWKGCWYSWTLKLFYKTSI